MQCEAKIGGELSPDGREELQIDYPQQRKLANAVGTNGLGLCVFNSVRNSGDWQGNALFAAMFDYMKKHPGGGYPRKLDEYLKLAANELGLPMPDYLNIEGNDLELLRAATRNGLMPAVTYWYSPSGRYNGQRISHMVSLVHATDTWFAVHDNNYITALEWLTPKEFAPVYNGKRQGWCVILLTQSPPPTPKGKRQ